MVARAELSASPEKPPLTVVSPIFEAPEKKARRKKEPIIIEHSEDWAWMLGALSSGGYRSPNGALILYGSDDPLLNKFKTIGQRLINSNGRERTDGIQSDGRPYKGVYFNNIAVASALGDLRRDRWFIALLDSHRWVIQNPQYARTFLEAFSENRCLTPDNKSYKNKIYISTSYPEAADVLEEMLQAIGLSRVHREYSSRTKKLQGLYIPDPANCVKFAQQIHSVIPEKERRLEKCRSLEFKEESPPSSYILAWKKAQDYLKQSPSCESLRNLYQNGLTAFAPSAYTSRFGARFSDAKSTLQSILVEDERLLPARLQELDNFWDIEKDKEAIAFYERRITKAARYNLEDKFAQRQKENTATHVMQQKEQLTESNRQLVVEEASRSVQNNNLHAYLPYAIKGGMVGLRSAIDTFAWRKGDRLKEHATPYIKEAITNAIEETKQKVQNQAEITIKDGNMKASNDRKATLTGKELSIRLTGEELKLLIILANNFGDPVYIPHTFTVGRVTNMVQSLSHATISTRDFIDEKTGVITSQSTLHGRIVIEQ